MEHGLATDIIKAEEDQPHRIEIEKEHYFEVTSEEEIVEVEKKDNSPIQLSSTVKSLNHMQKLEKKLTLRIKQ